MAVVPFLKFFLTLLKVVSYHAYQNSQLIIELVFELQELKAKINGGFSTSL